jgi:AMMECR1 domain-containing protein
MEQLIDESGLVVARQDKEGPILTDLAHEYQWLCRATFAGVYRCAELDERRRELCVAISCLTQGRV